MRKSATALLLAASFAAAALNPSGTLPVLTIDTENGVAVPAKTQPYVSATYSLESNGFEGVEDMSGETQIRGRGNYTWSGFDKKPYRLKLTKKAKLMGMNSSKHFALLAHADDNLGFMREPMGFWLSERLGLEWTPDMKPVEVVLNGDYIGLYFLVENIRVAKDRVNVFDQEEEAETEGASTDITGGWLCEIDNYEEDPSEQIKIKEGNGADIRITHKSPEAVTPEQENWLRAQMEAIDKAFYQKDPDSKDWQTLVDLPSLARFYVLQELMDGYESFHGSCYMYRDRGEDKKWMWGPVWDFGSTFNRMDRGELIYENPAWGQTWIAEIVKFTDFQNAYKDIFKDFVLNDLDDLLVYLDGFADIIDDAAKSDFARWGGKGYGADDVNGRLSTIKSYLRARIDLLKKRWNIEGLPSLSSGIYLRGEHNGWGATPEYEFLTTDVKNVYELEDVDVKDRFKIADANWGEHNWGGETENISMKLDTDQPMICGGESQNINFNGHVAQAVFTVVEPGKSATIRFNSTRSGLDGVADDSTAFFTVSGGVLNACGAPVSVYTPAGSAVACDVMTADLASGLYIVRQGARAVKIVVR